MRAIILQMSAMPADKDGIGAGNGVEVGFKEITYEDGDARSAETPAVDLHQSLSFGTDLKGGNVQVRELQFGFDGYGAGTETDIPERDAAIQFQRTECKQTDGSFGDHPGAPVQQFELFIGDSEWRETYMRSGVGGSIDVGVLMDNQAVGIFKGQFCRLLKFQPADTFPFRVAQMFADVHRIMSIAIVQHTSGYSGRCVFPVGENAHFRCAFYQCPVKFMPGTPCEGYGAHVVIRHD